MRGFRVTVGRRHVDLCTHGASLDEFLPATEIFNVTEAILRVFHRLGDYEHKQRNRMKFLIRAIGWDRFRAEFEQELAQFTSEGGASLPFDPERPPVEEAPALPLREPPSIDNCTDPRHVLGHVRSRHSPARRPEVVHPSA